MQDVLFKNYQGVFEEKEEVAEKKKPAFEYEYSPFALQDALGSKNPKNAWIEYIKLRFAGIEAESIAPNLISKARDMLGIALGAGQSELGIKKYFPYSKSQKDSRNWKKEELEKLYSELIYIYHESRIANKDLDAEVEKIILSL